MTKKNPNGLKYFYPVPMRGNIYFLQIKQYHLLICIFKSVKHQPKNTP